MYPWWEPCREVGFWRVGDVGHLQWISVLVQSSSLCGPAICIKASASFWCRHFFMGYLIRLPCVKEFIRKIDSVIYSDDWPSSPEKNRMAD